MFAIILGENISESFLLTYYSSRVLSILFIINALTLFCVGIITMSFINKVHLIKLFSTVILSLLGGLFLLRLGIFFTWSPTYLILFTFAYTGKILLFLAFWGTTSQLCTPKEAKSLYPLIGAWGIMGGLSANLTTTLLTSYWGPGNLFYIWLALLGLTLFFVLKLHRANPKHFYPSEKNTSRSDPWISQIKKDVTFISREPFLKTMAFLYFLIFFLLISLDFHFFLNLKQTLLQPLLKSSLVSPPSGIYLSEEIKGELGKRISHFLGLFRGIASLFTLFIQLFLASRILKRYGTAKSLFILPLIFTFIFLLCFLQTAFQILPPQINFLPVGFNGTFFALLMMGTFLRLGLFDSLFSPNFQIFFISLPAYIRGKSKLFLEGIAKPLAILLAGVSALAVSQWVIIQRPHLIWIHFLLLLILSLILCRIAWKLQFQYTQSISGFLGGYRAQQIARNLKMSEQVMGDSLYPFLTLYASDKDPSIRSLSIKTLSTLGARKEGEKSCNVLKEIINTPQHPHRSEALIALAKTASQEPKIEVLHHWLSSKKSAHILASLECLRYLPFDIYSTAKPFLKHPQLEVQLKALFLCWNSKEVTDNREPTAQLISMSKDKNKQELSKILKTTGELADPSLEKFYIQLYSQILKCNEKPPLALYLHGLARFPTPKTLLEVLDQMITLTPFERRTLYRDLSSQLYILQNNFKDLLQTWKPTQIYFFLEFLFHQQTPFHSSQSNFLNQLLDVNFHLAQQYQKDCFTLSLLHNPEADLLLSAINEGPLLMAQKNGSHLLALKDSSQSLFYITPKLFSTSHFERSAALEALETHLPAPLFKKWAEVFSPSFSDKNSQNSTLSKESRGLIHQWANNQDYPWAKACALYYLFIHHHQQIEENELKKFYNKRV